jgi:aerobic carbon-monoxide dehydrogenase medium subunit
MKPAPFAYWRPATVEEAVAALVAHDGDARLLAGGQSLAPMLAMRLVQPSAVVDINRIAGLDRIEVDGDAVVIGALARYSALERSDIVAARLPLLQAVIGHVGDRQIRNRGTIGGSLAQADPVGEVPLACLVLGATVAARGPEGTRAIAMADFVLGPYTTALEPEELLVEVRFPASPPAFRFVEVTRRHNDFAVVALAVVGSYERDAWRDLRLGIAGGDDQPLVVALEDSDLDDDAVESAVAACLASVDPPDDVRASGEYRRHLIGVHARRMLKDLRG